MAPKSRWMTPQGIPRDVDSTGPKVLAAGLWRCATSSLQMAFEETIDPPYRPSMHGTYVLTNIPLLKLCVHAAQETDKGRRQALLRQIFAGYNASSDYPGMAFVDDLAEMYPGMMIVLNRRSSARGWARSANETLRFYSTWTYALLCGLIPTCYWHWRMYRSYDALARRRFGEGTDIWSEEYYEVHAAWVRDVGRRHGREVLEWEPAHGWAPLCGFLGVVEPAGEFPRSNDAAEMLALRGYIIKCGLATWAVVVLLVAVLVGFGLRWW